MKTSLINFIVCLLLCFIGAGCKKTAIPDQQVKMIFGKWKVVNTSGGFGGGPIWPSDKDIYLEFKETGRYKKHEKGKLVKTEKFKFSPDKNNASKYIIDYDASSMPDQGFSVSHDTLILFDCYISDGGYYVCIKK